MGWQAGCQGWRGCLSILCRCCWVGKQRRSHSALLFTPCFFPSVLAGLIILSQVDFSSACILQFRTERSNLNASFVKLRMEFLCFSSWRVSTLPPFFFSYRLHSIHDLDTAMLYGGNSYPLHLVQILFLEAASLLTSISVVLMLVPLCTVLSVPDNPPIRISE